MRLRSWPVYLGAVGLFGFAIFVLLRHMTGTRVIARAIAPDGSELCLIQRWNGFDDPFFGTTFACKKPGTNWQTYYYHHEDSYWGHASIVIDTNARLARIARGSSPAITYSWPDEVYTSYRRGKGVRSGTMMPAGWSPER